MKLITESRVELIGRPILDPEATLRFLEKNECPYPEFEHHLHSEMDIGDRDGEWLAKLTMDNLKHVTLNFAIWDVSVALVRELKDNCPATYSQAPQSLDALNLSIVVPPKILEIKNGSSILYYAWMRQIQSSLELYQIFIDGLTEMYGPLLSSEWIKVAQTVLTDNVGTKLFMSVNVKDFRDFVGVVDLLSTGEIRELVVKMFRLAEGALPALFSDMNVFAHETENRA